MSKRKLETYSDIRRFLAFIIRKLDAGEVTEKRADCLKGLCYAILTAIQYEDKNREMELLERLEGRQKGG